MFVSTPSLSWREATRVDSEDQTRRCSSHSARWKTRLVSESDDKGLPAGTAAQRDQRISRSTHPAKAFIETLAADCRTILNGDFD